MSIKKWHQLAEEKSKLDKQEEEIRQKFRMYKINKEFGQLSGEEFFKPITKRLDEKSSDNVEEEQEEEQEVPDYTMDEFDEINPFGDEFRPDAPTPAPSPPTTPTTTTTPLVPTSQPPPYQEFADYPPPPPLMEETVMPESSREETKKLTSNRLRTGRSHISKFGHIPNYRVKSKESYFYGKSMEDIKAEVFKLETIQAHQQHAEKLLKRTQPLSTQLQEGMMKLKPPEKPKKREITKTPLEKAVMSRRPYLELSDNEDDLSEQDWGENEGSGIADEAEKIIDQLNLSLGSIKAGNNSIKLKKQVLYLLDSLLNSAQLIKRKRKNYF